MPPSSSRRPRCRTSTTTTRSAVVPAWSGRSSSSLRATAARVVLQEDVFERDVLDGHVRHRPGQELAQHSPDVLAHAGGEPGVADTVHRHALLQAGHELVREWYGVVHGHGPGRLGEKPLDVLLRHRRAVADDRLPLADTLLLREDVASEE